MAVIKLPKQKELKRYTTLFNVLAKYGFEDRALIEIVSKTKTGYDYSYYTYQEGTFIKRLRIN